MKRFLIPLLAALASPTAVFSGVPLEKDAWRQLDGGFYNYQINTLDAKVTGSKIKVGINRTMASTEAADGYTVLNWTGKVTVDCKKFKYTIAVRMGGLLPASKSYKITRGDIGYLLADNFCYLTGVEGFTKNDYLSSWARETIKHIESKPIKRYSQQGSVNINCDSPVWKNKPRCN